ncbi:hypothetical protein [Thermopetrobacter sp. TC1]|uniref:hypothetical protein n=1 Tax=Thermopetrobacter sp. TC1 TaxID=1495045 RepID=UPI0005711DCF|nr:hypothetical protein [Thermopetrobacter sp. TC1]
MKPTLILVGADKGGVGKTTISRALLDFFARRNVLARAFDTENPRGTLYRFHPGNTQVIDIEDVADQMKILDTLETAAEKVTVVDFKAGALSRTLEIFEQIGVFDAARDGQFDIGMVHVVGPAVASLDELQEINRYVTGIDYIVARNFINETNFFEWDEETYKKYFANLNNAHEIEVPKLNEMAYEAVDLAGVTFSDFINNRTADGQPGNFSFTLRGYVRKWLSDIDEQFEGLELIRNILSGGRNRAPVAENGEKKKAAAGGKK